MDRRTFLTTGAAGTVALAGCLGGDSDDSSDGGMSGDNEQTTEQNGDDLIEPDVSTAVAPDPELTTAGLAPDPDPAAVESIEPADPETFDTYEHEGYAVPLVPYETALYWYHTQEARFIDTRTEAEYENIHIDGAVLSPADDPLSAGGVEEWDEAERVVTYCRCPHLLASIRAINLYEHDHVAVFGIDEGLDPWLENGDPTGPEGDDGDLSVTWDVTGNSDPTDAGEFAWVRHEPTGQREGTEIAEDGAFSMTLHFSAVDQTSELILETPSTERVAPARDLVGQTLDLTN